MIAFSALDPTDVSFAPIAIEARQAGYRFIDRTIEEWAAGRNRFDGEGECFWGVTCDGELVGCGGVNQDPYTSSRVGRLRHVYILSNFRRRGLARALVLELCHHSKKYFPCLRLRTSDEAANAFYDAIGFELDPGQSSTHSINLRSVR